VISAEGYDIEKMKTIRYNAILKARSAKIFGVVFGTLGRQGSRPLFNRLVTIIQSQGKVVIPFLMAEINPMKLDLIPQVEVWVQVACPRLSIDWGLGFKKPVLTPYELEVCLGSTHWQDVYPMDYYSADGGTWANMYHR
jgi:2-(3-amino-3-carboxypropyl)histidine synthase